MTKQFLYNHTSRHQYLRISIREERWVGLILTLIMTEDSMIYHEGLL